jgi:hypothetical protein
MDTNQHDDGDERLAGGDLLVGADAIRNYLISLGWPSVDVYYLKRSGWPIGGTAAAGGRLVATKTRLAHHTQKLARGPP